MKYVKVMTDNFKHHDFQFTMGLNTYTGVMDGSPCTNGFHFCKEEDLIHWLNLHPNNRWIVQVKLCPDSKVVHFPNKSKTDKFILTSPVAIEDYLTPEICLAAVQQDGMALEYVKEQTPEICLAAVQKNEWALEYVKDQTPEICLAAVQQNGFVLKYVKEQTPEICLAAVKQTGDALGYVKEQTSELCLAAVKQTGWAICNIHWVKMLRAWWNFKED